MILPMLCPFLSFYVTILILFVTCSWDWAMRTPEGQDSTSNPHRLLHDPARKGLSFHLSRLLSTNRDGVSFSSFICLQPGYRFLGKLLSCFLFDVIWQYPPLCRGHLQSLLDSNGNWPMLRCCGHRAWQSNQTFVLFINRRPQGFPKKGWMTGWPFQNISGIFFLKHGLPALQSEVTLFLSTSNGQVRCGVSEESFQREVLEWSLKLVNGQKVVWYHIYKYYIHILLFMYMHIFIYI